MLPEGYTWRRPEVDDAEALWAFVAAYNTALVGCADYTLDDVVDSLRAPELEGVWMVQEPTGELCGFGVLFRNGDSDQAQIDVAASEPVANWLLEETLTAARELVGRLGHQQARVGHGTYRQDVALQQRLRRYGFEPATVFNRMRIDFDGPVATPQPPNGVVLRCDPDDVFLRRTAHRVMTEAFREHFGFAEWTAEEWTDSWEKKSTFDWSQLWVAELDGEPVGVLMTTDQFVEDENCGYVAELGVLKHARGRGLAKYLLRHAFARDASAGRVGTILHVDANNTTRALGVYESVGMRLVRTFDAFELRLDVATPQLVRSEASLER